VLRWADIRRQIFDCCRDSTIRVDFSTIDTSDFTYSIEETVREHGSIHIMVVAYDTIFGLEAEFDDYANSSGSSSSKRSKSQSLGV
jgi:hypothetical protein